MFDRYIALGDSISIDYYPQLDRGVQRPIGAASLLFRNDDELFPQFSSRDLSSLFPAIEFRSEHDGRFSRGGGDNLTDDGATLRDVRRTQLRLLEASEERTLITITAGGNDLLGILAEARPSIAVADTMIEELHEILGVIASRRPYALILVGTVYDPSDGTNVLYGQRYDRHAELLSRYNEAIRGLEGKVERVKVADIERHFHGHGSTAPESQQWYWRNLIFEPNATGASEVRRLWLETLGL